MHVSCRPPARVHGSRCRPTGLPACDPSPWVANANPFVLSSPSQFHRRAVSLTSPEYAADVNEVKAIGSLEQSHRTPLRPMPLRSGRPTRLRTTTRSRVDSSISVARPEDSARLFAMLNLPPRTRSSTSGTRTTTTSGGRSPRSGKSGRRRQSGSRRPWTPAGPDSRPHRRSRPHRFRLAEWVGR